MEPLLAGLGGALGAVTRHGVDRLFAAAPFPAATAVVNVLGTFLLGLLTVAGVNETTAVLVGVGFCGAFTTYATFSVDTVRLVDESPARALAYAVGTLVACLLAVVLAAAVATVVP